MTPSRITDMPGAPAGKAVPRRDRPAFEVEIFLTNRCNLACTYCSSRHLRDDREARRLSFPQLKKFVDMVAGDPGIKKRFAGPVRIEFAGGEPLVEFDLLKRTVDYIRARRLDLEVSIATNGTLLTRERADYLVRSGVDIRISLDGLKDVNDRNRVFAGTGRRSVFETVMANIRSAFSSERHLALCNISPTLDPRSIGTLPDMVKFFRQSLGVRKLRVGVEAFCTWDRGSLSRFREALRELVSASFSSLRPDAAAGEAESSFGEFPLRQDVRCFRGSGEPATVTLALFYDGYFYPSPDFVVAPPPPEERYRVGDLERGIDFKKLDRIFAPMLADISRNCAHKSGPRSPVEGYYWGVANGYPRKALLAVLKSSSEVNRIFGEETAAYMRLHRAFSRFSGTPGFGDLAHPPRHHGKHEGRALRLLAGRASGLVAMKGGVDHLLYSPGGAKRLVLEAAGRRGAGMGADIEDLLLYSLMKAGRLRKKVRLEIVRPAAGSSPGTPRRSRQAGRTGPKT